MSWLSLLSRPVSLRHAKLRPNGTQNGVTGKENLAGRGMSPGLFRITEGLHSLSRFPRYDQAFVPGKTFAYSGTADGSGERQRFSKLNTQPRLKSAKVKTATDEIFIFNAQTRKSSRKLRPACHQPVPVPCESGSGIHTYIRKPVVNVMPTGIRQRSVGVVRMARQQ